MIKLSVIIPAHDEAASLGGVLDELLDLREPLNLEIIVVNDGSTDDTANLLQRYSSLASLSVLHHSHSKGYGASLKRGIEQASGEYVVTYDADGQFASTDLSRLLDLALRDNLDAVFGERDKGWSSGPLWRIPGKWLIRALIRRLLGIKVRDFNCGLRLIRREVMTPYLHLCSDGFSFSTTSMMAIVSRGYDYSFAPVAVRPRHTGVSKVRISTGFSTILVVLRMIMLFNPLRIFLPLSLLALVLGMSYGSYIIWLGRGLSVGNLFLLLSSVLLASLGLIADQISELRKSQFER